MIPPNTDHNLLFGLLAVQMDFISREELTAAANTWIQNKSRPLSRILLDNGTLDEDSQRLLAALVEQHLQQHDGDVARSLEAVRGFDNATREELMRLGDDDVAQMLSRVAAAPTVNAPDPSHDTLDPNATLAAPQDSGEFEIGKLTSGERFRILRPHAKGGLGQVSLAVDKELNREVALKEIQPEHADSRDNRLRFVQEAEITGQLEHPGIVPVYGLGESSSGRPFYAMRFVRGSSLLEAINRFHAGVDRETHSERTVEFRKLLGHFIDVCNAIEYAHSRGILHRDLKPDNIMLGTYGETLVVDWGLAKPVGASDCESQSDEPIMRLSVDSASAPTRVGTVIGTPAYMSPEQATGRLEELGPSSDIYSLGATLYCLLAGQAPITDLTISAALAKVEQGSFPRPRELKPGIPAALEAICLRALARQARDRYQSARELADDVERYLADEAVTAHAEPRKDQVKRWMRKHPSAVTAAAVSVLLGLASLAIVLGFASYKNQQLDGKNQELAAKYQELDAKNQELDNTNDRLQQAREDALLAKSKAEESAEQVQRTNAELQQEKSKTEKTNQELSVANRVANDKREEAELARQRAQEARDQAKAVSDYLVNAFRSPDPTRDGREITVAEVLDQAAAELEQHLQDDPLVAAGLSDAIGQTYRGLGLYPQAISVLTRAHKTREELLGASHEDTIQTSSNLASAHLSAGDLQEAVSMFEQVAAAWNSKQGPDAPATLAASNDLVTAYLRFGDTKKSLELAKETLELTTEHLGPEHRDTLTAMNNLAACYRVSRQLAVAISLFEQAQRISEATLGAEHAFTGQAINNLAAAYLDNKQFDKAIPLFERSVEFDRKKFGPAHPNTLKSLSNLATSYFLAGDQVKALPLLEESLALTRAKLGVDHPDSLQAMNKFAAGLFLAGQPTKALPLMEEGLALTRAKLGSSHRATQTARSNLINAYRKNNEVEKALPHLEAELNLRIADKDADRSKTNELVMSLATDYLSANQPAKATAMFDRFLATQRKDDQKFAASLAAFTLELLGHKQYEAAEKYGRQCLDFCDTALPNHWLRPASQSMLGSALAGQGKSSEAERLLVEGFQQLSKQRDPVTAHIVLDANQRLVEFYKSRGQADEAAKWLGELENLPGPKKP